MSPRWRWALTLGLPLRSLRPAWGCAALVLTAYALTARDLTFYDSGEIALVAHQLGLGHPIGQPLHTWIGFLFAHLPGIDPITGLTALSALAGALAVLPAWTLAERLAGDDAPAWAIAPVLLACALHPIAWDPSTRVEVYSLAAFFALWALARAGAEQTRAWPVGLALGLAASTNAVIAAVHALAIAPRLFRGGHGARELGLAVLAAMAGLVPYVHVLLVAGDPARFVWGAPADAGALFAYFSGADYAHNAGIDAATFVAHLIDLAHAGLLDASLPIAALGIGAYLWRGRALPGLVWALPIAGALSIAFIARNVVFHTDVPDYRGYLQAPWLASASALAALAASIAKRGGRFRTYGAAMALLPIAALIASPTHLTRPAPSLARVLIDGAMAEAPRDAILLVEADHWVAPLLYAQEVEGTRPDLVILPRGLASSSWYWDHLFARHSALRPFALQGPGGRAMRIERFFEANAERPVLAESWELAQASARTPCGVGWLVWTGERCERVDPSSATARLDRDGPWRGEALEVAARVGLARGEALWRLGRGAGAYSALLAGLDDPLPPPPAMPRAAPPLAGPLPAWSRHAAIHDPARNVLVAALLCDATGQRTSSLALLDQAARMGLPEAGAARGRILAP